MKKIISALVLVAVMLSSLAVAAVADGTVYFTSDFSNDGTFSKDFYPEGFKSDAGEIYGYSDALALQTVGTWPSYDTEFTFVAEEDDLAASDDRGLSFVYINNNLEFKGISDDSLSYAVCFDFSNSQIALISGGFSRGDTTQDLVAPVPFEFEDGENYTFGVSITEDRIRVFRDDEIVIDYVDTSKEGYIGYAFDEVDPSVLLWWNINNYIRFSDIKVSTPGYLYPITEPVVTTAPADGTTAPAVENKPEDTKAPEVVTKEEIKDVTDDKGNAVTNEAGEKVTEKVIVSETVLPQADTNTGKPAAGNATATGDVSFVVVCAMVAAIGCALIVRKVSVR